ncbi:hypothetical protein HPP92_005237 [Vanilla planifolia]|uniref:Uncharacterized protein n=1 Tax=Vanilla planifolia TaxID=51239 RepID=A0A835VEF7_VANPL|nr:hypothetical protein HPP92_005237 [Vanilla planifolia]
MAIGVGFPTCQKRILCGCSTDWQSAIFTPTLNAPRASQTFWPLFNPGVLGGSPLLLGGSRLKDGGEFYFKTCSFLYVNGGPIVMVQELEKSYYLIVMPSIDGDVVLRRVGNYVQRE